MDSNIKYGYTKPTDGKCEITDRDTDNKYTVCNYGNTQYMTCQSGNGYPDACTACSNKSECPENDAAFNSGWSKFNCEQKCSSAKYKCNSDNSCSPDDNGSYNSLKSCEDACTRNQTDEETYCRCRKKVCGSNDDCMGDPNSDTIKQQIRACCDTTDCESFITNDSIGMDPCDTPVNYMCEGSKCIQDPDGRGPYETSYCDNECNPDHGPPNNKKSLGSGCNKNSDCMSDKCGSNKCIKSEGGGGGGGGGVPVIVWIGLGISLLLFLIFIAFMLRRMKIMSSSEMSM
jgi:hypothetical protein